mgnify:CR=1 FL=1
MGVTPPRGKTLVELFLSGKEICFRLPPLLSTARELLEKHLLLLLQSAGYDSSQVEIFFCIHELVSNGFKANLKRTFFQQNGLNIENMDDYRRGMEKFRTLLESSPITQGDQSLSFRSSSSSWVKVKIQLKPEGILLKVENNATLHYYERLRILDKESRSGRIQTVTELLLDSHDTEEGAGLGLLFLFYILKHRLPGSTFALVTEPGITRMELWFPSTLSSKKKTLPLEKNF